MFFGFAFADLEHLNGYLGFPTRSMLSSFFRTYLNTWQSDSEHQVVVLLRCLLSSVGIFGELFVLLMAETLAAISSSDGLDAAMLGRVVVACLSVIAAAASFSASRLAGCSSSIVYPQAGRQSVSNHR